MGDLGPPTEVGEALAEVVPTPPTSTAKEWTWVSGSGTVPTGAIGQTGVYGTQGVAATTNVPGGRVRASSWTDSSGDLWLFGGARTAAIFSGAGMVNVSPGREDMARRHFSNAGLLKKNRIMAGSLETFATPIQFPCGMKTVGAVSTDILHFRARVLAVDGQSVFMGSL
jgi:hypothetical protein